MKASGSGEQSDGLTTDSDERYNARGVVPARGLAPMARSWPPSRPGSAPSTLDAARAAGLDDDEIWDVGAITALFALSNRMAQLTALRPNPEFFVLGRVPRT